MTLQLFCKLHQRHAGRTSWGSQSSCSLAGPAAAAAAVVRDRVFPTGAAIRSDSFQLRNYYCIMWLCSGTASLTGTQLTRVCATGMPLRQQCHWQIRFWIFLESLSQSESGKWICHFKFALHSNATFHDLWSNLKPVAVIIMMGRHACHCSIRDVIT